MKLFFPAFSVTAAIPSMEEPVCRTCAEYVRQEYGGDLTPLDNIPYTGCGNCNQDVGGPVEIHLYRTNAPEAYDGFGTLTLETPDAEGWRLVAIRIEHEEWERNRYGSGLYPAQIVESYPAHTTSLDQLRIE